MFFFIFMNNVFIIAFMDVIFMKFTPILETPVHELYIYNYFSVNCWPNETASGCDVNIMYELERTDMELNDVLITIPLP